MSIKTVKLSKKYQDNIQDFKKEQKTVTDVIENTFNKFMNEANHNTMEYAYDVLQDDYVYVPNNTILTSGKYIRYLDLKNPMEIKLRIGGFVTTDNGYTVSIRGIERSFRVSKRNALFFSQISDTDRIRVAVNDYV